MRRLNRLWMLVLAAAMAVTGAMSEGYRTAHAETMQLTQEKSAPAMEVAEKITWDTALETAVGQLARHDVKCSYAENDGRMIACVEAQDVNITGYNADELKLYYHDDVLCMAIYELKSACSPLTYAMLDAEFQRLYGTAGSWDEETFAGSGCGAVWEIAGFKDDESMQWLHWLGSGSMTGCREWMVGDHTRLVLAYTEANTFLGKDVIQVVFFNRHPGEEYAALDGETLKGLILK